MQAQVSEKHFINRVTQLSKILAAIVFITFPIITLYVGYQAGLKTGSLNTQMPEIAQDLSVVKSENVLRRYFDPETKISFNYPAQWGEVVVSNERGTCDENYTIDPCSLKSYGFSVLKRCEGCQPASFMAAETLGHENNTPARGVGWQDGAGLITSLYLTECNETNSCEVVENDNKVLLRKTVRTGHFSGGDSPVQTAAVYQVYVSKNPYYGVMLLDNFTEDIKVKELFEDTVISSLNVNSQ